MTYHETLGNGLHGKYRDILLAPDRSIIADSGWKNNAIVLDCRRMLASLTAGKPALGIQGLWLGSGDPAWDVGGPPPAGPGQVVTEDPAPFLVPVADLQIDFIDSGVVTATPTNRLQIVATIGPGDPPWPDGAHIASSLREFGLVGEIAGNPTLINYVTHPVINKDPTSTLERTLWLVF